MQATAMCKRRQRVKEPQSVDEWAETVWQDEMEQIRDRLVAAEEEIGRLRDAERECLDLHRQGDYEEWQRLQEENKKLEFFVDFYYEALGPANDDIADMADEQWQEEVRSRGK